MARTISLGEALDKVEVDLFGTAFEAQPATRSLMKESEPFERELDKADDSDDVIAAVGRLLDIRLKSANGSKRKPSTIVKEKWEADELSTGSLLAFLADLNGAQYARPT